MKYRFNEQKLARLIEEREARHAALLRVTDRLQDARSELQKAQGRLRDWQRHNRGDAPAVLTEPVEQLQCEYDAIHTEHARAQERWQAIAQVVTPLEEAAAEWRGKYRGKTVTNVTGAGTWEANPAALFSGGGRE